MTTKSFASDFRRRAVEVSEQILERARTEDPLEANASLCVRTENHLSSLSRQKWIAIGCLVLGFAGLGGGAFLATLSEREDFVGGETFWLTLAGISSLTGFVCLLIPATLTGVFLRKFLGMRFERIKSPVDYAEALYVELEDAATFDKLKVASEDAGYLGLDRVNRRLVIEGVICRYVIRGEDVESIRIRASQGPGGVEIAFRIDEQTRLRIVVSKFHAWSEVWRQLTGKTRSPLLSKINETLGRTG